MDIDTTFMALTDPQDAGAKFVLESKGNWAHAGCHLTSATAGPPLLALPFAMAGLGWGPGILVLFAGAAVSFYGCYMLSLVMEEVEIQGKRCLRYRDLARRVIGLLEDEIKKVEGQEILAGHNMIIFYFMMGILSFIMK